MSYYGPQWDCGCYHVLGHDETCPKYRKATLVDVFPVPRPEDGAVYVVSTIRPDAQDVHSENRAVAVCNNFEDAKEIIMENYGDIAEDGYYKYAVVEYTPVNHVYPDTTERWWWKWNGTTWENCDCPSEYERVIGFGIG